MECYLTDISVIIPSCNDCERLCLTLKAFKEQSIDHKYFEIIVVDDGSTDDTLIMLKDITCDFKLNVVRLKTNLGRCCARNQGILASNGELLIFNDADMIPQRDFIKNHVKSHTHENRVVIGPIWHRIFTFYNSDFKITPTDIDNKSYFKNMYIADWSIKYKSIISKYGNKLKEFNFPWMFLFSGNMSIHKKKIIEAGMFDENFNHWRGEDWELGCRLYRQGVEFYYSHDNLSIHQEHPPRGKKISVYSKKSTNYIIKKHKCLEIRIFYLAHYFGYEKLNTAVNEYYNLKKDSTWNQLISGIDTFIQYYCDKRIQKRSDLVEDWEDEERDFNLDINHVIVCISELKKIYGSYSSLATILTKLLSNLL